MINLIPGLIRNLYELNLFMPYKNKNNKKLSVIIPIYNEPKIYKNLKLIEKELKKDFKKYEIICVDDGSSDNTLIKITRSKIL